MNLRVPQAELQDECFKILDGSGTRQIIAAVAPGGGKSKMPVILASILIPKFADRILWVVPRNSLKTQGEGEFLDSRLPTDKRVRATKGNESNPDRGTDGYITTFQAIGTSPESHRAYCKKYRTILFLDEIHHTASDSRWADGLAPMIDDAILTVFASGTLSRHDGQRIHGVDYSSDGLVNLKNRPGVRVIIYSRKQALIDGSILPVEAVTIDGSVEWISKEGVNRRSESLHKSGQDRADALFSMLRTEYAFQLITACMVHWLEYRKEFSAAKMIVVAPDIDTAKVYQSWIASRALSEIATSDDDAAADRAISDFRRGFIDILVCVGKCYEGLSVPEITHEACLTQFRSKEWLEQMQARANRTAPGKRQGWCFAPKDRAFLDAWAAIERETLTPFSEAQDGLGFGAPSPDGFGFKAPGIEPLWSSAHGVSSELTPVQSPKLTSSQTEKILLENIRAIYTRVVKNARPGSGQALATLYSHACRSVRDAKLEELTSEELTKVWMELRRVFGKRL